jgi:hypothetical protein
VLEALGKRAGPEDLRSKWQRHHDALEEACRRLIGAGMCASYCFPFQALCSLVFDGGGEFG